MIKYEGFLTEFKKGRIRPFYIFAGEENYLKEEALKCIRDVVVQPDSQAFNYEALDGEEIVRSGIGVLMDSCRCLPFFGNMKLVVVRHADKLCREKEIEEYARSPVQSTCLVLFALEDNRKLNEHTVIFYHPYPAKVKEWIGRRLKEADKRISTEALYIFQEEVGNDLGVITTEMEKLLLFIGSKPRIEAEDVRSIVSHRNALNIWNLVDAVAEKKKENAMSAIKDLLAENVYMGGVIGMIGRQLRFMLQAKELMDTGCEKDKIAKEIGYKPIQFIGKLIRQCGYFSTEELRDGFNHLAEAELCIKTSKMPVPVILEILVDRLCRQQR